MAATRLRKTFKFPEDDGADASLDDMDEEEQEKFIAGIRDSESSKDANYANIFTALPVILCLNFLYCLKISQTQTTSLLCILSITSLACSAYTMRFLPLPSAETGASTSTSTLSKHSARPGTQTQPAPSPSGFLGFIWDLDRPVATFLPLLNTAIGALLVLAAWAYRGRTDAPEGFWIFLLTPAGVFGVVSAVRSLMGEAQQGLGQLEGMKYSYKGA